MMIRAFVISMVLFHALTAHTLWAEQPLPLIGGNGGVYLLAEPGELVIDLEKRDLNRSGRPADLRAILVGPDRKVIHDITIADDGKYCGSGLGPRQQARLTAEVQRKGVYGLNITVSNDRYGTEVGWGFRTNAQKYLIETSRRHRDARREEPIVLVESHGPRDICFLPSVGDFDIQIADLEKDSPAVSLYDDHDRLSVFYHRLTVDRVGRLFLSCDCWSTYWFYRTDYPPSRRALMMSPDGGDHWQLVANDVLISFSNKASSDD